MKNKLFTLLILIFVTPILHAETMQGGSYVLNGSLDVIVNQGSGGIYTLNPNGDGIVGNSSGGIYIMYPTPYANPSIFESPAGRVVRSVTYGSEIDKYYLQTLASNSPVDNTNNPSPDVTVPPNSNTPNGNNLISNPNDDGTSGYYDDNGDFIPINTGTKYGYSNETDSVNFGRNTSASEVPEELKSSPVSKIFFWLFLIVILILILRNRQKKWKEHLNTEV